MIRAALLSLSLALASGAASAQTFAEAVQTNFVVALNTCVSSMLNGTAPATSFPQAGFSYRAMDRGVNTNGIHRGVGHYFDAPAGTVHTEVANINNHPGLCSVFTRHMQQPQVAALVGQFLTQSYPGTQTNALGWTLRIGSNLPLIISVNTINNNHRYEAPGTVRVSMSYPG